MRIYTFSDKKQVDSVAKKWLNKQNQKKKRLTGIQK